MEKSQTPVQYQPGKTINSPLMALDALSQALRIAQSKGAFDLKDSAIIYESMVVLSEFFENLGKPRVSQNEATTPQAADEQGLSMLNS